MMFLTPTTTALLFLAIRVTALNVTIVSLQTGDPGVAIGLPWTGAALQLAVQYTNRRYALLGRNIHVDLQQVPLLPSQSCVTGPTVANDFLAQFYYKTAQPQDRSVCYGLISNGCADFPQVAALASEYDWLLFNNGASDPTTKNVLNTAGTMDALGTATLSVLRHFHWQHVTVMSDIDPRMTVLYSRMTVAFMQRVRQSNHTSGLNVALLEFSGLQNNTIQQALQVVKQRSRVVIVFATVSVTLTVMNIASTSGMDNGEYVFFNLQTLQNGFYGKALLFNYPRQSMLNLTRSLFFVTFRQSAGDNRELNLELASLAKAQYNKSYDEFAPLDVYSVKATYDAVELFVKLAIENNASTYGCSGLSLYQQAVTRTYHLTSGDVVIDDNGNSLLDADILVYDSRTRTMQPSAFYSAHSDTMVPTGNVFVDWPTGGVTRDVPLCGFVGANCSLSDSNWRMPVLIAGLVVIVALLAPAIFITTRHMRKQASDAGCWWLLNPSDIVPMENQTTSHLALWKGRPVWDQAFPIPLARKPNIDAIGKIHHISHPNINTFCGIVIDAESALVRVYYDYCKRGSLADLLSRMKLDLDFQISLIHDLLKGCVYLARHAHPHGHLQPETCLIDDRFTLRIGGCHLHQIRQRLCGTDYKESFTKAQSRYIAPELLEPLTPQGRRPAAAPADVYAVGRLIQLIVSADHGEIMAKFNWMGLVEKCTNRAASLRPEIHEVQQQFHRISASNREQKTNVVEAIVARFENYAAELEIAVKIQSDELMAERDKCDELLQEMLPKFIVDNLRNQIPTEPAYFDSVTIFFSEINGFSAWIATVQPETVMQVLSSIYSIFDHEISRFDVYKVETTKDSYVVVGGIPEKPYLNHASELCAMALAFMTCFTSAHMLSQFALQCGIHSGPCAAGVVGRRVPRYCLFGDTVNTASRMNSQSQAGRVQLTTQLVQRDSHCTTTKPLHYTILRWVVSSACRALVQDKSFRIEERGSIPIKGKGMMTTYWLLPLG